jgi:hypothetical protein
MCQVKAQRGGQLSGREGGQVPVRAKKGRAIVRWRHREAGMCQVKGQRSGHESGAVQV